MVKSSPALALDVEFVEVTRGVEKFSPISYHSFDVGPFTARARVREGETIQGVITRLRGELDAAAAAEYESALKVHLVRVAQSAEETNRQRDERRGR